MITREQCLKWAKEVGIYVPEQLETIATGKTAVEALCQRVWNEAMEAALIVCQNHEYSEYCEEEIRKLKVTK